MNVEIIVLNYNGVRFFPEGIPSLVSAQGNSSHSVKLTVIDNQSTDESVTWLKERYPDIAVIPHANNYLCSFNDVVAASSAEIVILLNNDIKVACDFIDPLLEPFFEQSQVFLVAPKVLDFDGNPTGAHTRFQERCGALSAQDKFVGWEDAIDQFHYTFSSGFGAFRREVFVSLAGYDDLYLPGIMEDVDLCFRGWRHGYVGYYQPRSIVYHLGQATFTEKFGKPGIRRLAYRNGFLFMTKNISDWGILTRYYLFLPLRMIWALLKGDWAFAQGWWQSLFKRKEALSRRTGRRGVRSASDIVNIFKG